MYQNNNKMYNSILILIDLFSVSLSYVLANLYWLGVVRVELYDTRAFLINDIGIVLFSFVFVIFLFNMNRDFLKRSKLEELFYCIKINLIFAAVATILVFLVGNIEKLARGIYVLTFFFNMLIMTFGHVIFKVYVKNVFARKKKNTQMFIITTDDRAEVTLTKLLDKPDWIKRIYAVAIVDANRIGDKVCGISVVADAYNMLEYVKKEAIDEVLIDVPYNTGKSTRKYIMELEDMGVVVHLNLDKLEVISYYDKRISMLGNIPVVTVANKFFDPNKLLIKRLIDIAGALVGIIITFVVTIFLAPVLLIESPGPLFFKQKRVGRNGRFFNLYKFRSMYKDAEERKKALMDQNEMSGHMFKLTDDPRVTRVGKFIRKTSIDELPQFINVLKGDMSLVGTRPPTVEEFRQYEHYHKRRLSMKPGITGLWQVSGRSNITDFEEVVKLDLQYIDNWTLGLDIKIIIKTIGVVFKRRGAS